MSSDRPVVVHRFGSVSSTQDEARRLLEARSATIGHVVVADVQTAGRGRFGRTWLSPRGGLYATFLIRPRATISIDVAVAALRALSLLGIETDLKWPNDLLIGERKLAGLLIESIRDVAFVGMGINLVEAPCEGSVSVLEAGRAVQRGDLVVALAEALRAPGGTNEVLETYRRRLTTIGRRVQVTTEGHRMIEGEAVAVDDLGRLIVESSTGRHTISTGECVHLRS